MSSEAVGVTFRSQRVTPQPLELQDPIPVRKSILVVSPTEGIGEMVGKTIDADENFDVHVDTRPLTQLLRDEQLDISKCDIVVFEAHSGNDLEMRAFRELRERGGANTRYLAMTVDNVTLSYAKELIDAGVDEVLPLSSVDPEMQTPDKDQQPSDPLVLRNGGETRNGAIIAISQTRGGIGATSLALNLGYVFSEKKKKRRNAEPPKRVAVLDLDFQNGTLGASVDIEETGAFLKLLKGGEEPPETFAQKALVSYKDRIDILPAPVKFAPLDSLTPEMVATILAQLRNSYDFIIIDLPRALVRWIEPILARTDMMLIVTDTSVSSVRQARRLIDFYTEEHVGLPIKIVVSKERKPFSMSESLKEASRFLERPLDHWIPRDDAKAKKAADLGQPMIECAPRSAIAKPLKKLTAEIREVQAASNRREA